MTPPKESKKSKANKCSSSSSTIKLADPYVKVKFAEPNKVAHSLPYDILKTNTLKKTNNPVFELKPAASFMIDGMNVHDLYQVQGLIFKVKNAHTNKELGHAHLTTAQLLIHATITANYTAMGTATCTATCTATTTTANNKEQPQPQHYHDHETDKIDLGLLHPTTGNSTSASITIRCSPVRPHDVDHYRAHGWGYFVRYAPAAQQPSILHNLHILAAASLASHSNTHEDKTTASIEEEDERQDALTVATSAPSSPERSSVDDALGGAGAGCGVGHACGDQIMANKNVVSDITTTTTATTSNNSGSCVHQGKEILVPETVNELAGATTTATEPEPAAKNQGMDDPYQEETQDDPQFHNHNKVCPDDCFAPNCVIL